MRSYLTQLVGPDRAKPAYEHVLASLADGTGGAGPDGATVRKLAQSTGLDALDAEARRFGRRIARTTTARRQCLAIARRLRDRAEGHITAGELDSFYRHLERCQACAGIAGRFEASEWYLQVELGPTKPTPQRVPAPPQPGPSPDRSLQPADEPEPEVTVEPTYDAVSEPEPEPELPLVAADEPTYAPEAEPEPPIEPAYDDELPLEASHEEEPDAEPGLSDEAAFAPVPEVSGEPTYAAEPEQPIEPAHEPELPFEADAADGSDGSFDPGTRHEADLVLPVAFGLAISHPVVPPPADVDGPPDYPPTEPWPDHVATPSDWSAPWPESGSAPEGDIQPPRGGAPPDSPLSEADRRPDDVLSDSESVGEGPVARHDAPPSVIPPPGFGVQGPPRSTASPSGSRAQRRPAKGLAGSGLPPAPSAVFSSEAARPRRVSRGLIFGIILALVLAAASVVVLVGHRSKPSGGPAVIQPVQKTTTNGAAGTQVPVITHGLRTPFEIDGARFAVFVNGKEPWTTFAKHVSAGAGKRWVLVTVRVRNLSRTGFDPLVLHYRLIASGTANYFPDLTYGTGSRLDQRPTPMAVGELEQAELAYAVPASAKGLQLAFDPTSGEHERVVVALGQ